VVIRQWARPAWSWVQVRLNERRASHYVGPPNHVVFDDDPNRIAGLDPNLYLTTSMGHYSFATFNNNAWYEMQSAAFKPWVAFLHARTSPDGTERIVAIYLSASDDQLELKPYVTSPDERDHGYRDLAHNNVNLDLLHGVGPTVRVFDGQIDSQDGSKFTIDIEVKGQRYTVDGQLLNKDIVTLQPRTGLVADLKEYKGYRGWVTPGIQPPAFLKPVPFVNVATTQPHAGTP
jgi:hypothetical protein